MICWSSNFCRMRVLATADRMVSMHVCDDLYKTCDDYWKEKFKAGEMTQEKLDSLRQFFGSEWELWDEKKVDYYQNPIDSNRHFALGFTGKTGILRRYREADKRHVRDMHDLAKVMHEAHICELEKFLKFKN